MLIAISSVISAVIVISSVPVSTHPTLSNPIRPLLLSNSERGMGSNAGIINLKLAERSSCGILY
jgi:hypothetical protein